MSDTVDFHSHQPSSKDRNDQSEKTQEELDAHISRDRSQETKATQLTSPHISNEQNSEPSDDLNKVSESTTACWRISKESEKRSKHRGTTSRGSELRELENEIRNLETKLHGTKKKYRKIEKETRKKQDPGGSWSSDNRLDYLETRMNNISEQVRHLELDRDRANDKIDGVSRTMDRKTEEMDGKQSHNDERYAKLNDEVRGIDDRCHTMERRIEGMDERIDTNDTKCSQLEQEIENKCEKLEKCCENLQENAELSAADGRKNVEDIRKEIGQLEEELRSVQEQNRQLELRVDEVEKTCDNMNKHEGGRTGEDEGVDLSDELRKRETVIVDLLYYVRHMEKRSRRLEREIEETMRTMDEHSEETRRRNNGADSRQTQRQKAGSGKKNKEMTSDMTKEHGRRARRYSDQSSQSGELKQPTASRKHDAAVEQRKKKGRKKPDSYKY